MVLLIPDNDTNTPQFNVSECSQSAWNKIPKWAINWTAKSKYDKELPQSQTEDKYMAPRGRVTEYRQPQIK